MIRRVSATPPTDLELVERANRGDADAFAMLYDRYRDFVLRTVTRFTGDRDLAAEVVQETVTGWLTRFPGFALCARRVTTPARRGRWSP